MDQITDNLWIGDIEDVRSGDTSRFDVIVSVCQDHARDNVSDETPYFHFKLADSPETAGKYGGECNYDIFSGAADCVRYQLEKERTVLVHCHVGQNRSAAICAAALGVYGSMTYDEALAYVEAASRLVDPEQQMEFYARTYIQAKGF